MLVISGPEVRQLLPMFECIELMSDALKTMDAGDAILPLRQVMPLNSGRDALYSMPGYVGGGENRRSGSRS